MAKRLSPGDRVTTERIVRIPGKGERVRRAFGTVTRVDRYVGGCKNVVVQFDDGWVQKYCPSSLRRRKEDTWRSSADPAAPSQPSTATSARDAGSRPTRARLTT